MKPYSVYIDLNDGNGYLQVYPVSISPFKKGLESGELSRRYEWGKVIFRNQPDKYRQTGNTAYNAYDLIHDIERTKEIKIRFIAGDITIDGYFGDIDGEYQDDPVSKTITVTPTTADQYTDFLTNYEEKIDVVGALASEKIVNGDFSDWLNESLWPQPTGWTLLGDIGVTKEFYNDSWMCGIESATFHHSLRQSITVTKDQFIEFTFEWLLLTYIKLDSTGEIVDYPDSNIRDNRDLRIELTGESNNYYLDENGKWQTTGASIRFAENELCYHADETFDFNTLPVITSEAIPENGTLAIVFDDYGLVQDADLVESIHGVVTTTERTLYTQLLLDNVSLKTSNTPFITVNVDTSTDYIQRYDLMNINSTDYMRGYIWYEYDKDIKARYFNEDGSPKIESWDAEGSKRMESKDGLLISDFMDLFDDPAYKYYKCQISKITFYQNGYVSKSRRQYADIEVAREEIWSLAKDADTGEWLPPQEDAGWEMATDTSPTLGKLWVRKPFNDEDNLNPWVIGDLLIDTYDPLPIGKAYRKVISARDYTTDEHTLTYNTAIDLRDVIKAAFNAVHPKYADKEVYSTFLWNDNEDDIIFFGYDNNTGANYLDLRLNPNPLNKIACIHTPSFKDEIDPDSDETTLELSFKDLMDDLKSLFIKHTYGNLYWFIDEDYNLHIEHARYREMLGYTYPVVPELQNYRNYKYKQDSLYNKITLDQVNSGYPDFTETEIIFNNISSGKRKKEVVCENQTRYLTTDLRYCIENPNNLDNGLCLVNYQLVDGEYKSVDAQTQVAGKLMLNGELALTTLAKRYGLEEGTFLTGTMNGEVLKFKSIFRAMDADSFESRKYVDDDGNIVLSGILDGDYLSTSLGIGLTEEVEHDFDKQKTTIKLMYGARPAIIAQRETDYDGAPNEMLDFGFYIG